MQRFYKFPATFLKEENGYTVEFPNFFPYCCASTCGRTEEEAIWMAQDLLGILCEQMEEEGWKIEPDLSVANLGIPVKNITVDMKRYRFILKKVRQGRYRRRMTWKAWDMKYKRQLWAKS